MTNNEVYVLKVILKVYVYILIENTNKCLDNKLKMKILC